MKRVASTFKDCNNGIILICTLFLHNGSFMWRFFFVSADYVLSSQQLVFPSGSSSSSGSRVCSTVQPENDDILEPAVEMFQILMNSSDPAVVILPAVESANVSITEDIRDGRLECIVHNWPLFPGSVPRSIYR